MISIIIPLYNKEHCIKKTIASVLQQDFKDYEIIVVDDGSTDNSIDIVKDLDNNRIQLYTKPNGGPSSARNYGVKKATGDWIVFIDADDYFEPNAFHHFANLINEHPQCKFFCCNHYIEKDEKKWVYSTKYSNGYIFSNFYSWCVGQCMPRAGAALFHHSVIEKHPFNENLRRYEDAESLFDIMRQYRIFRSNVPVMTYNNNDLSASAPCRDISKDFIGHLNPKGKGWWEQYALYQLYIQGCCLYHDEMKRLYRHKDFWTWKVRLTNRYLKYMRKFKLL